MRRGATALAFVATGVACGGTVSFKTYRSTRDPVPVVGDGGARVDVWDEGKWRESAVSRQRITSSQPTVLAAFGDFVFATGESWEDARVASANRTRNIFVHRIEEEAWTSAKITLGALNHELPVVSMAADPSGLYVLTESSLLKFASAANGWVELKNEVGHGACGVATAAGRLVTVARGGSVREWDPDTFTSREIGSFGPLEAGAPCPAVDVAASRVAVATDQRVTLFESNASPDGFLFGSVVSEEPRKHPAVAIYGDFVAITGGPTTTAAPAASKLGLYGRFEGVWSRVADVAESAKAFARDISCVTRCRVTATADGLAVFDDEGIVSLAFGPGPALVGASASPPVRSGEAVMTKSRAWYVAPAEETPWITAMHGIELEPAMPVAASASFFLSRWPQTRFGHSVSFARGSDHVLVADDSAIFEFVHDRENWEPRFVHQLVPGARVERLRYDGCAPPMAEMVAPSGERSLWRQRAPAQDAKYGTWDRHATLAEAGGPVPDAYWVGADEGAYVSGDPVVLRLLEPVSGTGEFVAGAAIETGLARGERAFVGGTGVDILVATQSARQLFRYKRSPIAWVATTFPLESDVLEIRGLARTDKGAVVLARSVSGWSLRWLEDTTSPSRWVGTTPLEGPPTHALSTTFCGGNGATGWLFDGNGVQLHVNANVVHTLPGFAMGPGETPSFAANYVTTLVGFPSSSQPGSVPGKVILWERF